MGPEVVPEEPTRLENENVAGKKFMIGGTQAQFGRSVMMAVMGYTEGRNGKIGLWVGSEGAGSSVMIAVMGYTEVRGRCAEVR